MASGRRSRRRRQTPMADINVTPMVDVMLVLLIIFVVAAPLLVTGVAVDLPETQARALPSDDRPITVTVDRHGQRAIDNESLSADVFAARINALFEARPDARVLVRADAALPYGQVASLLAEVTTAGFKRVALVNQPASQQPAANRAEEPARR